MSVLAGSAHDARGFIRAVPVQFRSGNGCHLIRALTLGRPAPARAYSIDRSMTHAAQPDERDGKTLRGSPDRFGYEWAVYATILPESKGQLECWLGSTGLASSQGKKILDVGCGMGRNPYWMAKA